MNQQLHFDLSAAARRSMIAHGFEPEYPPPVAAQLEQLHQHPVPANPSTRDLRGMLWSSIDNDTSKDLDQIEDLRPVARRGRHLDERKFARHVGRLRDVIDIDYILKLKKTCADAVTCFGARFANQRQTRQANSLASADGERIDVDVQTAKQRCHAR